MGISNGSNKVDVLQAPIPFTKVLMAYRGGGGGQFGDTTHTKVFVGGLAWETQRETMRKYFEQFGEILEAVVITDKNTGRSKGYGFVTFRDPESARKACVDASPIIDGRRANCNLASLGAQRLRLSTPQHLGNRFKILGSYPSTFQSSGFHGTPTFNHPNPFTIHQGFPYHSYGYSPYATDYATYSPNYYNAYGGSQVPVYAAPGMLTGPATLGPYVQFTQSPSPGYPQAMQVPQMMQLGQSAPSNINLNTLVPPYGASMLTIPAVAPTGAMTLAVQAPSPQAQHYQMHSALQAQFAVQGGGSLSEQPS